MDYILSAYTSLWPRAKEPCPRQEEVFDPETREPSAADIDRFVATCLRRRGEINRAKEQIDTEDLESQEEALRFIISRYSFITKSHFNEAIRQTAEKIRQLLGSSSYCMIQPNAAHRTFGQSAFWVWQLVNDILPSQHSSDHDWEYATIVYLDDAAYTGSQTAGTISSLSHILDKENITEPNVVRLVVGFGAISDEARIRIEEQAAREHRIQLVLVESSIRVENVAQKLPPSIQHPTYDALNAWMTYAVSGIPSAAEASNTLRHCTNRFPQANNYYATILPHTFPGQGTVIMRHLIAYGLEGKEKEDTPGLVQRPDWRPYENIKNLEQTIGPVPWYYLRIRNPAARRRCQQ